MRNAPVSEENPQRAPVGVFVGLATLDVIHRIAKPPAVNEKIASTAQFVAAGGPAANAAVTFAALGGEATLVTALGDDPVADLIRADLTAYGVSVIDAAAGSARPVPVSSVAVVESTGDRSVISSDAVTSDAAPPDAIAELVARADVVLVDGHHPLMARAAAQHANQRGTTVVVDAGRWKPVMADLVPTSRTWCAPVTSAHPAPTPRTRRPRAWWRAVCAPWSSPTAAIPSRGGPVANPVRCRCRR